MKALIIVALIILPAISIAQVKHNFEMEPSNTNCDDLPGQFDSADKAIKTVESSKFRFQQSVKISRYRSPRSAVYYSCDGKSGYLVVEESDSVRLIYSQIPEEVWDQFVNTNDPIYYYTKKIKSAYEPIQ